MERWRSATLANKNFRSDTTEVFMSASHAIVSVAEHAKLEAFVDADAAAAFLGITRRTLLQKVRTGKLPGHPVDPAAEKKDWRFLLSELNASMLSCELRPPGALKPSRRV